MKRTILVGVDGSESSLKAIRLAAELAERHQAVLILAYVAEPLVLPPTISEAEARQLKLSEAQSVEDAVRQERDAARARGIAVEMTAISDAQPSEALAGLAKKKDAWIVAVGHQGRRGVQRLLLGSVAHQLVHLCDRPVLIVR